jgi:hypothetical protein
MHGYASASRLLTCRAQVLKSYIGGFPLPNEPPRSYTFDIPGDIRRGPSIFSWSWNNKLGNREFYQDCGPIVINSGDATICWKATLPCSSQTETWEILNRAGLPKRFQSNNLTRYLKLREVLMHLNNQAEIAEVYLQASSAKHATGRHLQLSLEKIKTALHQRHTASLYFYVYIYKLRYT